MPSHRTGTREEWRRERLELLRAEKELTRKNDELTRRRQQLPWVPVEQDYRFDTEDGPASLVDLFGGRSQLLIYHFMFPGCPSCSSMADGFNGFVVHLQNHDVGFAAVCRSSLAELLAYRDRMGWSFPFVSSASSTFNFDFGVSFREEQIEAGSVEYNFQTIEGDLSGLPRDLPGTSAFAREGDQVFHTFSSYGRGGDVLWGLYQWLDRAPLGRNETETPDWMKLRDEYA